MTSISYSFNLDPVMSAATQRTTTMQTETDAAIGAKYQAAQPAPVYSTPAQAVDDMAGLASPACDNGGCFIVHSEGPGVTTLSIGEEDGGAGEYLSFPVVDGVQFMEPPISSFASAGDYDITTLAIGEEDGGIATAAAPIGTAQTGTVEFALSEPMPMQKPMVGEAVMAPVQTAAALPPIQTTPIMEPRPKPAMQVAENWPVPDTKPMAEVASAPQVATAPETVAAPAQASAEPAAAGGAEYVSVGDYDAYIASLGSDGAPATETRVVSTPETVTETTTEAVVAAEPAAAPPPPVTFAPPPLPADAIAGPVIDKTSASGVETAATSTATPERIEVVLQPAQGTVGNVGTETVVVPPMKPATFTTPGPATLPPIQAAPVTHSAVGTTLTIEPTATLPQQKPAIDPSTGFTSGETPFPSGKPESIATEAPRLSAEDYRITTLALGEEDAGGG